MLKKIILILVVLFFTGCSYNIKESSNSEVQIKVKAIINNNEYIVNLEDNETVNEFIKLLPLEFNMNELNGNEKYIYLNTNLPSNSLNIEKINKGDIMLFGNNCIVIFYESFNTTYQYTKIGHIDNLPNLGKDNILVRFEKKQ